MEHKNLSLRQTIFAICLQLCIASYGRGFSYFYERKSLEIQYWIRTRNRCVSTNELETRVTQSDDEHSNQTYIQVIDMRSANMTVEEAPMIQYSDLCEFFEYANTFDFDKELFKTNMLPALLNGYAHTQQTVGIKLVPVVMLNGISMTTAVVSEKDVPTLLENNQSVFSAFEIVRQYSH